jgi:hypothetical protein
VRTGRLAEQEDARGDGRAVDGRADEAGEPQRTDVAVDRLQLRDDRPLAGARLVPDQPSRQGSSRTE